MKNSYCTKINKLTQKAQKGKENHIVVSVEFVI